MGKQIVAAAQVLLYINGAEYAKVSAFSFSVSTPKKEIRGIDSTDPTEYAVTTQTVTGQMEVYRQPADGGFEGTGIAAPLQYLSQEKYFSLAIVDQLTNATMFSALNCTIENQSWSFQSRALITGTMQFKALTYSNEVSNITTS
jgi:hypothetical protein